MGMGPAVSLTVGFVVVAYFGGQFLNVLNGSLRYAPAFLLLLAMGFHHYLRGKKERGLLLAAAGVFSLSLVFRTIDNGICPYFAPGTHFLWHLLNSVVLYLLLKRPCREIAAYSTTSKVKVIWFDMVLLVAMIDVS